MRIRFCDRIVWNTAKFQTPFMVHVYFLCSLHATPLVMNHHICISFQLVTVIVSCMYLTCMYCLKEPRDTSRKSRDRRSDVRADGDDDDRDAAAASTAAVDYDRHKRADVDKPSSTVAATNTAGRPRPPSTIAAPSPIPTGGSRPACSKAMGSRWRTSTTRR